MWTSDKLLIWLRALAMEVESRYSKSTTQDPLKGFPGNTIIANVSYRQFSYMNSEIGHRNKFIEMHQNMINIIYENVMIG